MALRRLLNRYSIPQLVKMTFDWSYRRATAGLRVLPDYLIIGAQRCGTTSLYEYLVEHPDILPSFIKEAHFFDKTYQRGITWYRTFFPLRRAVSTSVVESGVRLTGEATPYYFFDPDVPRRVKENLPDVKLLVLLRNPVDRAYSHFQMNKRLKVESRTFKEAVREELELLKKSGEIRPDGDDYYWAHHSYLGRGLYANQLDRWYEFFPQEQILTLHSETLYQNPDQVMTKIFQFLDLPVLLPDRFDSYNSASYPPLDSGVRAELEKFFEPFNQRLFQLTGVDLQ